MRPVPFQTTNKKGKITMVDLLQSPQKPRTRSNLILHCGAHSKSRNVVKHVPTPKGTATWTPIPHILLIEEVERALKTNGLTIANQAHSLTHDQSRYFGLMEVRNGKSHEDYAYVLGLRNSHDKRFPAGIVAGMSVFVCDNLSFSGEIKIARKHTRFILRDIPMLTQDAIGRLMERWHHQDARILAYKGKSVSDRVAHEPCRFTIELRGHPHLVGIDCEVDDGTCFESEEGCLSIAVILILDDGVRKRLVRE